MNEIVCSFSNDTGFNVCMLHAFVCRNIKWEETTSVFCLFLFTHESYYTCLFVNKLNDDSYASRNRTCYLVAHH